MLTVAETKPMAKKKAPGAEAPTKSVKIDRTLVTRAEMIAAEKGLKLSDYLSGIIRGTIDREWSAMVRKAGGGGA